MRVRNSDHQAFTSVPMVSVHILLHLFLTAVKTIMDSFTAVIIQCAEECSAANTIQGLETRRCCFSFVVICVDVCLCGF